MDDTVEPSLPAREINLKACAPEIRTRNLLANPGNWTPAPPIDCPGQCALCLSQLNHRGRSMLCVYDLPHKMQNPAVGNAIVTWNSEVPILIITVSLYAGLLLSYWTHSKHWFNCINCHSYSFIDEKCQNALSHSMWYTTLEMMQNEKIKCAINNIS